MPKIFMIHQKAIKDITQLLLAATVTWGIASELTVNRCYTMARCVPWHLLIGFAAGATFFLIQSLWKIQPPKGPS